LPWKKKSLRQTKRSPKQNASTMNWSRNSTCPTSS
jgi:hypothetical protein